MLIIHIIAMVSTTIAALVKSILLLLNRKEAFRKVQAKTSGAVRILLLIGVFAGIYIVTTKFGGIVAPWLIIKICLFIAGGITVMIGEKKENKLITTMGTVLLLLAYTQANVKLTY